MSVLRALIEGKSRGVRFVPCSFQADLKKGEFRVSVKQNDEIRDSFNKKGLLYSFLVSICWHVRICLAVYGPENRAVSEKES